MFLCGLGLLPLDCGISGLLTVVSVMVFAFTTVFFSMLTSERPCSTALGRCRTISCVCGTMLEGYVFMFCMLSITSVLLVQRFSRMVHHHRIQHRTLKPTLIVGSLMLTLTGIFPQRYDVNDRADSAAYGVFTSLHLVGIFGAGALLLCVPFFWFAEHWYTHRRRLPSERVPLRSLIARAAYFFAICGFSSAMLVFGSDYFVSDQVWNQCDHLLDQHDCESWPALVPSRCDDALRCVSEGADADGCDGFLQPNFECAWMPDRALNNWTRTIMPLSYRQEASCVRLRCPLDEYARGVALEFAVLLLTISYVSVFGLHDVKRLLDRPPPDAASLVLGRGLGKPHASLNSEAVMPLTAAPQPQPQLPLQAQAAAGFDTPSSALLGAGHGGVRDGAPPVRGLDHNSQQDV